VQLQAVELQLFAKVMEPPQSITIRCGGSHDAGKIRKRGAVIFTKLP
jgi:hypothetical protein